MAGKRKQKHVRVGSELQRVLQDVGDAARFLWERGWAERNAGNISVNVTDCVDVSVPDLATYPFFETSTPLTGLDGRCLLVTISGSRMRDVAASIAANTCIIRISESGHGYHIIWGNERPLPGKPTSELPSHLAIHQHLLRQGSPRKAVVHTHPTELIALTHIHEYNDAEKLNQALWAMHPEVVVAIPEGIGLIPYSLPGTEELARAIARILATHTMVLLEKHGCLATGVDVLDAFDRIDVVTKSGQILMRCLNTGFTPQGLTRAQIEELKQKFTMEE